MNIISDSFEDLRSYILSLTSSLHPINETPLMEEREGRNKQPYVVSLRKRKEVGRAILSW